ncbi:hypothetical protein F4810DRAFT_367566 [Camillea tinctor]|nr:hypothetical protein F4810DRAFT_367566 [Camillea tinctor]
MRFLEPHTIRKFLSTLLHSVFTMSLSLRKPMAAQKYGLPAFTYRPRVTTSVVTLWNWANSLTQVGRRWIQRRAHQSDMIRSEMISYLKI